MSDEPVSLPTLTYGRALISGTLKEDPQEFSFSFLSMGTSDIPENIAYQLKVDINQQKLFQNRQENGEWMEETEEELNQFYDKNFNLEFLFDYSEKIVNVYAEGHNYLTSYNNATEIATFQELRVLGDVEINELQLAYQNTPFR